MRKQTARVRGDGEKTREALIEAAGTLAAERGWSNVAAKDVCDMAGVNCASVNYWFGGRDELYQAVLSRIPDTIFSQELEIEMVQYETVEEALRYFFTHHLRSVTDKRSWPIRVWAREVTGTPSENILAFAKKVGVVRIQALQQFFADYLGLDNPQDPRVGAAFMTAMSAALIHLLVAPELRKIVIPGFLNEPEKMNELIIHQIMLGLAARRAEIEKEKAQGKRVPCA